DKYVAEILKKFGFSKVKTASTLMETSKPLLKNKDGQEVDTVVASSTTEAEYVAASSCCGQEEVYDYQPPGFEDPDFPDKVYKVKKALYGCIKLQELGMRLYLHTY
nr:retrotransposon protein, putative, unclassified [Tanacetum cinerariifolium]